MSNLIASKPLSIAPGLYSAGDAPRKQKAGLKPCLKILIQPINQPNSTYVLARGGGALRFEGYPPKTWADPLRWEQTAAPGSQFVIDLFDNVTSAGVF